MTETPVPALLQPADPGQGIPYRAFTVGSGARLILPEECLCLSLALYNPQAAAGLLAKTAMRLGVWRGAPLFLDRNVVADLERCLASALGAAGGRCAFHAAAAGPTAKVVALVMDGRGGPLAYAKIAEAAGAKAAVAHEVEILEKLAAQAALEGRVPRLLAVLDWRGCRIALLSPGPVRRARRRFGPAHAGFLAVLRRATEERIPLRETPVATELESMVSDRLASLPREWRVRYRWAAETLRRRGGEMVATTLAHGDFAPWNARLGPDGTLFVFDWEFAVPGMTAGYDAMHYRLAWWASCGRRVTGRRLRQLMELARLDDAGGEASLPALAALAWIALVQHRSGAPGRLLALAGDGIDGLRSLAP